VLSERRGGPGGRRPSGFTLIEILFAVTLLGVGVASLSATIGEGLRAGESSKRRLVALHLAQARLEQARRIPYAALPLGSASESPIAGYALFAATTDVAQTFPRVKGITVTVAYPEGEVRLFGCTGET